MSQSYLNVNWVLVCIFHCLASAPASFAYLMRVQLAPYNPLLELTVYSKVRLHHSQFGCFHHNKHFSQPIPLDLTLFCSPYTTWCRIWVSPLPRLGLGEWIHWRILRSPKLQPLRCHHAHQARGVQPSQQRRCNITNKRYSELLLLPYQCSWKCDF